jgi:transcriptional regulator GlxA family with amidase domain
MGLRVSHSKKLLMAGHTVKEVAEETGFYDAFHCSKTFKKVEGRNSVEHFLRDTTLMPSRRFQESA